MSLVTVTIAVVIKWNTDDGAIFLYLIEANKHRKWIKFIQTEHRLSSKLQTFPTTKLR